MIYIACPDRLLSPTKNLAERFAFSGEEIHRDLDRESSILDVLEAQSRRAER